MCIRDRDAEAISRLIKERITPLPQFILKPLQEDGKNLLALEVSPGRSTCLLYTSHNNNLPYEVSRPIFRRPLLVSYNPLCTSTEYIIVPVSYTHLSMFPVKFSHSMPI